MLLHDHLDGGLRPSTLLELANEESHALPASDAESLGAWLHQGEAGSLGEYLAAFSETVAVMQTAAAVQRVAYEAGVDLAADGIVYAEVRYAPALSNHSGFSLVEVVESAQRGLSQAAAETGATFRFVCDAMRQDSDSIAVAEAALATGVAGFDLAGPEAGFPPRDHREALSLALDGGLGVTIHAGEAAGVDSIADALLCGAQRIGHGVRIIEDCRVSEGRIVELGPVARDIHDRRIPLELCVTSNFHTMGLAPELHPIGLLHDAGFVVTVNTDNRLMSGTSMTTEFSLLTTHHGFDIDDLAVITKDSLAAAFVDEGTKSRLWNRMAGTYRAAGASASAVRSPDF